MKNGSYIFIRLQIYTTNESKMPPQKNSGNKGAKRETGASAKNRRFVQNLLDDLRAEGNVEHVHVGRVLRRLGDGRMEVFYVEQTKGGPRGQVAQAVIRGSFRGRGKHSVWIDVGSFVAIAETGVSGPSAREIVGVLTADQLRDLAKDTNIDPRVLMVDNTDGSQLLQNRNLPRDDTGYEFDGAIEEEENEDDVDIENI